MDLMQDPIQPPQQMELEVSDTITFLTCYIMMYEVLLVICSLQNFACFMSSVFLLVC